MCVHQERNSQLSSPNIPGFGTSVDLAKYTNSEKKMYLFIEMYRKPSKGGKSDVLAWVTVQ